jgi:hypothetical protein
MINKDEIMYVFIAGCIGDIIIHALCENTNFFAQGLKPYYSSLNFPIIEGAFWGGFACVVALLMAKIFKNSVKNNYVIPIIFSIFGLLILIGYYGNFISGNGVSRMVSKYSIDKLWSNNGKNIIGKNSWLKKLYMFMILLSTISTLYLMYYMTITPAYNEILRYVGILLFLLFSLIWAYDPFYRSKIVLFMVSLGVAMMFIDILMFQGFKGNLALLAGIILLLQSFVFDFIIWNGII